MSCTLDVRVLLPPANKVWDKVMFLHLSVILFMGGMMSLPVWLPNAMFLPNGGLCPGDLCREGVSVQGRSMSRDSLCP